MSLFVCFILCVTVCVCVCVPTPSLSPSLSVSLSLHIVWFSLLWVPSGQACLHCHPFSIPSRFKHPPVMSSETLNSKFLGDSPQDLALIPYWPLVDTTGHGQSQKNHILCRVLNRPGLWEGQVSWRKGKGVKNKQQAEKIASGWNGISGRKCKRLLCSRTQRKLPLDSQNHLKGTWKQLNTHREGKVES